MKIELNTDEQSIFDLMTDGEALPWPAEEIANKLNKPLKTVYSLLKPLRKIGILREEVSEEGLKKYDISIEGISFIIDEKTKKFTIPVAEAVRRETETRYIRDGIFQDTHALHEYLGE